MPDVNKSVEENMIELLRRRRRIEAVCFNECNGMTFHNLSRHKVGTETHDLTSLLGLGPKFCPQVDRVSFRNSVSMIARLCRDASTRWFVLNNNHTSKDTVSPRLHRRNDDW